MTTKSEEEAQNLLSSSRENKNKISINRSISVKTLDRKCLKKEIDMIDQLKRELSLEKKEKAKVNLLANKINEFLKIFLKILKENKILETFLEDLMTGYNNLLNYTYEIEKVIGVKNGGGIFFLQNIERLSIIIEEIKDCKSFSNFSKNIQYLTKSETRNELSMISSLNGSINKFPEECPEECNSFPKIRKFSKINYKKSFDISNI